MELAANDPAPLTPEALAAAVPAHFLWGVATSSYQIEGGTQADGRGTSIWDTFCRVPGAVRDGDTGDIACDHYNRWEQDLDLIASIVGPGGAYRFSIAWPRVRPQGGGPTNTAGLDFYDRLVDGLIARDVVPFPTLFHWDLPQAQQDRGGWPARDTALRFGEYATDVVMRLGDRVEHWLTINEPYCSAWLGHLEGVFAPGEKDIGQAVAASHHLLLSHGLAVQAVREHGRGAQVGPVFNLSPCDPASDDPRDVAAAHRADGHTNRWWADPVFGRGYPADMVEVYGVEPPVHDGDLDIISAPIDFFGLNLYFRFVVGDPATAGESTSSGASGAPSPDVPPHVRSVMPAGAWTTAMGWEVHPEALTRMLRRLHEDYGVSSLYVTENGSAWDDEVVDGAVKDEQRTRYLAQHVAACAEAVAEGIPLNGYFHWSLMDNFEWAQGYSKRFGIVHVDFQTQVRTLKQSGAYYRDLIAEHRAVKGGRPEHR
jgi:beta-glucosidase